MHSNKISSVQIQLAEILNKIPSEKWQMIVRNEPEWQHLEPIRKIFPQGAFSVFMLAVGLNAYQLKGKAEMAYWYRLYEHFKDCGSIPSLEVLEEYLVRFYQKERIYNLKIGRLLKFLNSQLANELWKKSPREIADATLTIWKKLSKTMNQAPHEKTICFAMKCLGISLMMADEYDFDFNGIPIPVDSRIKKFTNNLGIDFGENIQPMQDFWDDVLTSLRQTLPQINMIHLDSLIWQIAHHDAHELMAYFETLAIYDVGESLSQYLFQS